LSLFFKLKFSIFCFFLILLSLNTAYAIQVSAVYLSTCNRVIGIIIDVDDQKVQLVNTEGTIQSINRFDITYIAYYPLGSSPIHKVLNPEKVKVLQIKTLYKNRLVDHVQGWMIDYSENKISILNTEGKESIVDLFDIWDLEYFTLSEAVPLEEEEKVQSYNFYHPYPFMHCQKKDPSEESTPQQEDKPVIYPQHLLGTPLLIKKELDRLKAGYEKIKNYHSDKQFYPVPQIFNNSTSIGVGLHFGSRYGASANRLSSFTPLFISELSEGPFGYQRIFVTGSAPMPYSVHEEAQTQMYYHLKADYIHFSIMYDPIRLFSGEQKYYWHLDDLSKYDDRLNQIFHVGGGFDFGPFSFDFTLTQIQYAIRHEDLFFTSRVDLNKFGLFYHNRYVKLDLYYGFFIDQKEDDIVIRDDDSPEEKAEKERLKRELAEKPAYYTDLRFYRVNLKLSFIKNFTPRYSFIYRSVDFYREKDWNSKGAFQYVSESYTNAIYGTLSMGQDLKLDGFLAVEAHVNKSGVERYSQSGSRTFIKGGVNISIQF